MITMDITHIGHMIYPGEEYNPNIHYNYLAFYQKYLKGLQERKYPKYKAFCPFHNDTNTPNLEVNVRTGWFKCYACGKTGNTTDISKSDMPTIVSDPEELAKVAEYEKQKKVTPELAKAMDKRLFDIAHNLLKQQPIARNRLYKERGIFPATADKWKIGYLEGTYTFPIYDRDGNFTVLKQHKRMQTIGAHNQIYPWNAVTNNYKYVILCEGEFDMILLRQYGFNACTFTCGCNSWGIEFLPFFKNKTTYISYDNDEPGNIATNNLKIKHLVNEDVRQIIWPSFMKIGDDVCDFFITYKRTMEQYRDLLAKAA